MSLPEKEYFSLPEIERRWRIERADTVYYAENGMLEVATRVRHVMVETGFIEIESSDRWFSIPDDQRVYSGLLPLQEHDLSKVFLHGEAEVHYFRTEGERYLRIIRPQGGLNVHVDALVISRAERDRFEREHGLTGEILSSPACAQSAPPAVVCSADGGWIEIRGREYIFTGYFQKAIVRRLYEARLEGNPRIRTQRLLEDIGSLSKQISQVFNSANPRWREIILYAKGYVWLSTGD